MSKDTETVNLAIDLPTNVYDLLEKFAHFAGVTVEDILKDELDRSLPSFWQNEMFQAWAKKAIIKAGCAKYFEIRVGE